MSTATDVELIKLGERELIDRGPSREVARRVAGRKITTATIAAVFNE